MDQVLSADGNEIKNLINYHFHFLINSRILLHRIQPSENWIQSQIPDVVKNGVLGLGNRMDDVYEMDAEAFVQAYVNIVVGACISLGNFLSC